MPDIGVSKDALRAIIPLTGEFVGTTDTQTLTTKTINTTDNTLTATSQAAGDILVNNATKFVRLARGTAGQPIKVNAGATDIEYGTLPVIGGGTGATTFTGILKGAGTGAVTAVAAPTGAILGDSDVQNITGSKTFYDQTFFMRNRANTASLRFRGPTITSDADSLMNDEYDFLIFIDADDGNIIKAKRGKDQAILYSHATDTGAVLNSVIAAISNGGKISFLPGTYTGTTQHLNTNKKRIEYNGNGATLTGFTIKMNGGTDTSAAGKCNFRNITFSGASAGVIIDNTHLITFEHCYFEGCTVGISLESSAKWSENMGLMYTHFQDCVTSILFKAPTGAGTGSYINSSIWHCTFNNTAANLGPFTYIKAEALADISESIWIDDRFWFNNTTNCTAMDLGGACSRLKFIQPYFENFSSSVGTTGVILQSTVTGSPYLMTRPVFGGSGAWTGKFINASNKSIHGTVSTWRQNHTITPSATINTYGTTVSCLTSADWGGMPNTYVIIGGTLAGGETVSVRIQVITYSAFTASITKTYTATGTYPLSLADYQSLTSSNYYTVIESFDVAAKSSIAATAATVSYIGLSGGTASGTVATADLPTINATTNTITDTSTAAGDVLKSDGTKFTRFARGAANLPLKVNSGATDIEYGALAVAGGGTGQVTAAAGFDALSAMTTLGDTQYGGASGTRTRLAGNTTAVRQLLAQTGDGANSAAPTWATPKQVLIFTSFYTSSSATNNNIAIGGSSFSTTESAIDLVFDYAFTVKRFRFVVSSNGKTAAFAVAFRDDGVDVTGTSQTVGIGATAEFDSGALSVDVAAGSKINFKMDLTGTGAGALTISSLMIEAEMPLQ